MSTEPPRSDDVTGALPHGTRIAVRTGAPTPEELAAVVLALDSGVGGAEGRAPDRPPQPPAWQQAARLEGVGFGQIATAGDLERPGGPGPGRLI